MIDKIDECDYPVKEKSKESSNDSLCLEVISDIVDTRLKEIK